MSAEVENARTVVLLEATARGQDADRGPHALGEELRAGKDRLGELLAPSEQRSGRAPRTWTR